MMAGTTTLGLDNLPFFGASHSTRVLDGISTGGGVADGGRNDEKPGVDSAFEPQVVQNDSFAEIS